MPSTRQQAGLDAASVMTKSSGFSAGVLSVEWTGGIFRIAGRAFVAHTATLHIDAPDGKLPRSAVTGALCSLIVHAPDGELSRVHGVESHTVEWLQDGSGISLGLEPMHVVVAGE